jgi:hypothetical protein
LPEKWTNYFVFHVLLLKPYRRRPDEDPAFYPKTVLLDKDEKWYKVKGILDDR